MERVTKKLIKLIEINNPQLDKLKLKKIEFGLRCIFSEASKLIMYLIIFSLFSMTTEFVIALIFFILFRGFAGGYHAETYWRCFFTTLGIFIGIILLGNTISGSIGLRLVFLAVTTIMTFIYAPVDHPNKPIISRSRRKKLKITSITAAVILGALGLLLPDYLSAIAETALFAQGISLIIGNHTKRGNARDTVNG